MNRAEHWKRARLLLAPINDEVMRALRAGDYRHAVLTEADRERLAVAQVHATLAAAASDVAGEGTMSGDQSNPLRMRRELIVPSGHPVLVGACSGNPRTLFQGSDPITPGAPFVAYDPERMTVADGRITSVVSGTPGGCEEIRFEIDFRTLRRVKIFDFSITPEGSQ